MDALVFRSLNFKSDRENILRITRSSGLFEDREVALAATYLDAHERGDNDHTFLLADLDGITIGYSNFGRANYAGLSWYVHWIAIDNSLRGKGLGSRIMAETEQIIYFAGGRKIFVETSSKIEYLPTHNFYYSCGYTLEAKLKDFYVSGDDQLIFSKVLARL